jgi:hypothetical protein
VRTAVWNENCHVGVFDSEVVQNEITHASQRAFWTRPRPRGRADEGRFGSEGWRGGSDQGFDHEGGRRFGGSEEGQGFQGGWGEGEFGKIAQENWRHHHDEDYHHWRNEQLRKFDQDYDEWRNERRQKFTEDFNKWRLSRPERTEGSRTTSQVDLKNK